MPVSILASSNETHRTINKHIRDHGECGILVDLPGPKIRLGQLEALVDLVEGQAIHFTTEDIIGNMKEFPINYTKLLSVVYEGGHLFINDGIIDIGVTSIDDDKKGFKGKVVSG